MAAKQDGTERVTPAPTTEVANHATVVTRRSDRRIMGHLGERRQLCGGEPTDRDVHYRDAKRHPEWVTCRACRAKLPGGAS